MVQVGDRVVVEAEKVGREPRTGVVLGVEGPLIQVRWDNGGESSFVPSAGSMRVVGRQGG
ncbi:MAG: DUF1918 domain-containing protein [Actinomycetota bacterium]|nr:DUF1918 domain-containing protein [Actinomycetota bacterium]